MAGNQVTLTFAGDSSQLERSFGNVGQSARDMEGDVGSASASFDRVGDSTDDLGGKAERTAGAFGALGSGVELSRMRSVRHAEALEEEADRLQDVADAADKKVQDAKDALSEEIAMAKEAADADDKLTQAEKDHIKALESSSSPAALAIQALEEEAEAAQKSADAKAEDAAAAMEAATEQNTLTTALMAGSLGFDAITGVADLSTLALKSNLTSAVANAAGHVRSAATVAASWVLMGIQATINAVKMAAAWLIGLGPVGLVIAGVTAVIAILIALGVGFDDVANVAKSAWGLIQSVAMSAFNWLKTNWPLVLAILTGPFGLAVLAFVRYKDQIIGIFASLPGRVKGIFSSLGSSIVSGFKSLWNNTIGGFGFTFGGFDPPGPGSIPGFSFRIPYLHTGGVYQAPPGQREGLAMLLDGERVLRPGQSAGGGMTVNVYVQGSIRSDRELVKVIRDEMFRGGFRGGFA